MKKKFISITVAMCFCFLFPILVWGSENNSSVQSIRTVICFESDAINGEIIKIIQLKDGSIVGIGSKTDGTSKLSYMDQRTTGDEERTALVFKFDSNGSIAFLQTFGGNGYDRFNDAFPTLDGGFIATGYSNSYSGGDFDKYNITGVSGNSVAIIVKYDNNGNVKWAKACNKYEINHLNNVYENDKGEILGIGSNLKNKKCYIMKLDATGNSLLEDEFVAASYLSNYETINAIELTDNGETYICGIQSFDNDMSCAYLSKIDMSGEVIFKKTFTVNCEITLDDIVITTDGNIIIIARYYRCTGGSNPNKCDLNMSSGNGCFIIAFQPNGEYKNSIILPSQTIDPNGLRSLIELDNGDVLIQFLPSLIDEYFIDNLSNKKIYIKDKTTYIYRIDSSANLKYLYEIMSNDLIGTYYGISQFEQLNDGTFRIISCENNCTKSKTRILDVVDKFNLDQTIHDFENLKSSDYTSESWNEFNATFSAAIAINKSPTTTQKAVDNAYKELKNKATSLVQNNENISFIIDPISDLSSESASIETTSYETSSESINSSSTESNIESNDIIEQENSDDTLQEIGKKDKNYSLVIFIIIVIILFSGFGVYYFIRKKKG